MKVAVLVILAVLIVLLFLCGRYNSVDCHPQVHLTIINNDTCNYVVSFYDKHTYNTKIEINDTIIYINSKDTITNVIDYYYTITDDSRCFFLTNKASVYNYSGLLHISIAISILSNTVTYFDYYPWDTASAYIFPGDCTHKIYDTLILPFEKE